MMNENLSFKLSPSVSKWLFDILILCCLGYLLSLTVGMIWSLLILLLLFVVGYRLRKKTSVLALVFLTDREWIILCEKQQRHHVQLIQALNYGCFVFLKFVDFATEKQRFLCIAKDQLPLSQWKILKKFIKLN